MAQTKLLAKVTRLMSEGKGDRVIAETLDITRHQARNLMREVELANAKQGASVPVAAPMPAVLENDADAWALLINGAFRRSYDSIIEAGRLLIAAKEKLAPHGTWLPMLETKLDFSPDTAQRLMSIARDDRLTNTAHARFLPRSYTTLAELTKLSDEQFTRGIEENIISPDMERKDVDRLRPRLEPTSREERASPSQPEHHSEGAKRDRAGDDHPNADDEPDVVNALLLEAASATPCVGDAASPSMPGGGLAIAHNRVEPAESLDFFPTPPWATRALFEHVLKHLDRLGHCQFQKARDPCCGNGLMSEVMSEYFPEVIASDIGEYDYKYTKANYLEKTALDDEAVDWFMMNSPFGSLAEDFCLKSIEMAGVGVAMFVRLQWLETPGRYQRIFSKYPPSLLAIFAERVPVHKGRWVINGKTMTAYAWVIWIKGMEPKSPFWIPPGCREALSKPDDAERFGAVWEDDEGNIFPTRDALIAAKRNEAPAAEAPE